MEALGYGTHLIIDASKISASSFEADTVRTFLAELAHYLEPSKVSDPEVHPVVDLPSGLSAVVVLPEAHASIHVFETAQTLSLRVFSRHELEVSAVSNKLRERFGARRFESHLSNYSKTIAKDPERRLMTLLGDRAYTAARLLEQTAP